MTIDMTGYEHIAALMRHEEDHRQRCIAYYRAEAAAANSSWLRDRCLTEAHRLANLVFPWERPGCGCGGAGKLGR